MKKTISLVLALVMVFAIASSASAITGLINPEATVVSNAPYTNIDLQLIESVGTGFGLLTLQQVAANKAYIYDGVVHFALYFKTPAAAAVTMHRDDYSAPAVLFSSDIVKFYENSIRIYNVGTSSIQDLTSKLGVSYDGNTYMRLWVDLPAPEVTAQSYVIVGSGAVAVASNGTIQADLLGCKDCIKFLNMPTSLDGVASSVAAAFSGSKCYNHQKMFQAPAHAIYSGTTKVYEVYVDGNPAKDGKVNYTVSIIGGKYDGYSVVFVTDYNATVAAGSHNNVDKILVLKSTVNANQETETAAWLVQDIGTILGGNAATQLKFFKDVEGSAIPVEETDATTYAKLKAVYEQVMGFFELEYAKEGVLIPQHFAYKFSTFHATDAEKITLYTSTITIPDENTDIPQTGDAATSIGFVMIALAIVAACGVAYKKVRA